MNKIAILTDSASNIKENLEEGIFIVHLYVNFKDESKKDLLEINPEELYERIEDDQPTTSAPSVEDFLNKIKLIKDLGYEKILAISLSQALSGTYNAMKLALESQDLDYKLLDSKNITMSQGLLIMYGHKLIKEGLNLENIAKKLDDKRKDLKLFATVSDLKYLVRGGRLSTAKGLIGGKLRINPILRLDNQGAIENYKSIVGKKRALKFLLEKTIEDLKNHDKYYLAIAYAKDKDDIGKIKEKLSPIIDKADLYIEGPVTAVLGTHSGPSVYVISYLKI